MRKLLVLTILAVAFSSCSNVGQYKEAIESLSSNWESTTNQVSATVEQLTQVQEEAKSTMQNMNPSEEMMAKLSDEQKTKLTSIQQTVQDKIGSLGALSQQAFEFVNKWQEEGEKLEGLKDGLSSGKLPGDVESTISNLKSMVDTAKEKASEWGSQVDAAKQAIGNAQQSYNGMMDGLSD